jgi:hypothetical protein
MGAVVEIARACGLPPAYASATKLGMISIAKVGFRLGISRPPFAFRRIGIPLSLRCRFRRG